ncbi:jg1252 [Pararge aegeria aegeria]|uniref:Jg1252 protein n=1 Tax=Pararge aegeria aegeria TaxID=348720 RepID=A0A8S4R9Q1_9NEOP|nr:jg1252 [Pararge aegeria aegeria]
MEMNGTEARGEEAVTLALSVAVTVISAIGLLLNAYILFVIIITKQTTIDLLKGVPNFTVLCPLCPAAPCCALDVICPPRWGRQRSAYQCKAAIPAPWGYVDNSGSSTDFLISDRSRRDTPSMALSNTHLSKTLVFKH